MKVIVAGSRSITDIEFVFDTLDNINMEITEVVCGMAKGVDIIGKEWAETKGIPVKEFPAAWGTYGRAAGPIRNGQMAAYADRAIVIYRPEISKGSKNMIEQMKKCGKPVLEVIFE